MGPRRILEGMYTSLSLSPSPSSHPFLNSFFHSFFHSCIIIWLYSVLFCSALLGLGAKKRLKVSISVEKRWLSWFKISISSLTYPSTEQMTIMIESSRTFLWTEYARDGCGTLHSQGTDPKVWDKLPVRALSLPHLLSFLPHLSVYLWEQGPKPPSEQRKDEKTRGKKREEEDANDA
jgi:hypothetical protein